MADVNDSESVPRVEKDYLYKRLADDKAVELQENKKEYMKLMADER